MKKLFALAAITAAAVAPAHALTTGDIAFVAYNTDTADNFAWVALADIAANTSISFTDSSWQNTGFRMTEHLDAGGPLTWTHSASVTAGTVISFNASAWSVGSANGALLNFSTAGDQIFAFVGTPAAPTFIQGIQFAHATGIVTVGNSNSTNTTNVPAALSLAAGTMVNVGNFDNGHYSGTTIGLAGDLRMSIADTANWTRRDTGDYATSSWPASFQVTPIPEPETYALMLAGLAAIGLMASRRQA